MQKSDISTSLHWIKKNLYPHIVRYKWALAAGTVMSCAMAGLNYYNLQLVRQLFDERSYLDSFRNFSLSIGIVFSLIFIYSMMNWFQTILSSSMVVNINKDMIETTYARICNMPFMFFYSHSPGQLLTLLLNDITQVTPLIPLIFIDLVKNGLILSIVLVYLIKIEWMVVALYVCLGLGYLLTTNFFMARIMRMLPSVQKTRESIQNKLIEYLQVINLLKIYDVNNIEKGKVYELNDLLAAQNKRIIILENTRNFVLDVLVVTIICGFVLLGYNLISHEVISAGKFISILIASYLVNGYVRSLFDVYSKVQQIRVYIRRLNEAFSEKWDGLEKDEKEKAGTLTTLAVPVKSVAFQGVSFSYHRDQVLNNINCSFEPDVITGITGGSGYGKTTILNMILKLIVPTKGTITVNGLLLNDIDSASYLKQISYLPQNSLLFNGTIAENIAFGEKNIDRDKVIRSATMANIHEYIEKTKHGYDTRITTGISSMSEGERKRIEIARALYKDSSIIILDEPTANLDIKNKIAIIEVLKMIRNKVLIIVTHDLSVLENCGKIMLINSQKEIDVMSSFNDVYKYYAENN